MAPPLDTEIVRSDFVSSGSRLIFMGMIGTLTDRQKSNISYDSFVKFAKCSESNREALTKLTSDPNTTVVIITSRTRDFVDNLLGECATYICAENGCFQRDGNDLLSWKMTMDSVDVSWMDEVAKVMKYYVDRTPHSVFEAYETFCCWQYRDCDKEFAEAQARDLVSHLQSGHLVNTPTEVIHSQAMSTVQVRLAGNGKSAAVTRILQDYRKQHAGKDPEFVLCVGNYIQPDEDVFTLLQSGDSDSGPAVFVRRLSTSGSGGGLIKSASSNSLGSPAHHAWNSSPRNQSLPGGSITPLSSGALSSPAGSTADLDGFHSYASSSAHHLDVVSEIQEMKNMYSHHHDDETSSTSSFERIPGLNSATTIVHTSTVGKKPTLARAYLEDVGEVEKLLRTLSHAAQPPGRSQTPTRRLRKLPMSESLPMLKQSSPPSSHSGKQVLHHQSVEGAQQSAHHGSGHPHSHVNGSSGASASLSVRQQGHAANRNSAPSNLRSALSTGDLPQSAVSSGSGGSTKSNGVAPGSKPRTASTAA